MGAAQTRVVLGQPRGEIEEGRAFRQLAEPQLPLREHFEELDCDLGVGLQEGQELPPVEYDQLGRVDGGDGRRAPSAGEEGELSDNTAIRSHEQVSAVIDREDSFAVGYCHCRHTNKLAGSPCKVENAPERSCFYFGKVAI
jgi:hypothetical protein